MIVFAQFHTDAVLRGWASSIARRHRSRPVLSNCFDRAGHEATEKQRVQFVGNVKMLTFIMAVNL